MITTKQFRPDQSNPDEVEVTLDKYGRTSKIREKSHGETSYQVTKFTRQDLWESAGAAEVVEMYDPYEKRTYKYTYDDFNNCTGYEIRNGGSDGSNFYLSKRRGKMR